MILQLGRLDLWSNVAGWRGCFFIYCGSFREFPVIGVSRVGLRWVEEGATWAAAPSELLSEIDMDLTLEKEHKALQGTIVITMDGGAI